MEQVHGYDTKADVSCFVFFCMSADCRVASVFSFGFVYKRSTGVIFSLPCLEACVSIFRRTMQQLRLCADELLRMFNLVILFPPSCPHFSPILCL